MESGADIIQGTSKNRLCYAPVITGMTRNLL